MKVTIFGATGRTGQQLVKQAIAARYDVTVLARNPAKLAFQDSRLTVVQGDVKDAVPVTCAVTGAEAVLSVLGPAGNTPIFDVSQGMQIILVAMRQQGVRRLVLSAGAGVGDPKDAPKIFNHVMNALLKVMAGNVYEDMRRTVELVRASDRDWTVVRVPMLTDDAPNGIIKVGYVGKGMGARIGRAELADFMLRQVADQTYLRQAPAISN